MIKQLILVGLGGGIGSIFRYSVSRIINKDIPGIFPLGTFVINMTGCLIIGVLMGLSLRYEWFDKDYRLLLITGFCGGYTTFSAFSLENMKLFENGNYLTLALYVSASIIVGMISVWLGFILSK